MSRQSINYIYRQVSIIVQSVWKRINKRLPTIIILIIVFSLTWSLFAAKYYQKEQKVIYWDVVSYYSYLPATFIYKDITLEFMKDYKGPLILFWPLRAPNGARVIKMTMGLSFLYAPFFFMGHLTAQLTEAHPGGFSWPYKFFLQISSIFYLIIGLYFLKKILQKYFSNLITAATLFIIVIGTNLYHYASYEGTMSHVYNFSAFILFLWSTIKWHEKPDIKYSLLTGFLAGLISLIRPSNMIIILIFILWGITSYSSLKEKIRLFLSHHKLVLLICLVAFLVWIPQLLYWKYLTGQWFYYSYPEGEKFFFSSPQIIDGLFSFRKGWLIYTPVMSIAIVGIFFLRKKIGGFFIPITIFLIVNVYIIFSWWCWWYGGSYGQRALIDSYGLLALPLAAFMHWVLSKKVIIKYSLISLIIILTLMGTFHTIQYHYQAIHWDGMTKEAYFRNFLHPHPQPGYDDLIKRPDYDLAKKGIYNKKTEKKKE